MRIRAAVLGVVFALVGCSTLEVRKVNTLRLPDNQLSEGVGVRYFLTKPVWKVAEKTAKDGVSEVNGCEVVTIIEVTPEPTYVPDPDHFYEARLSPGLFSSDSFTLDLKEHGSLAKLFARSEPQVTEAIRAAASIAKAVIAPTLKMVVEPTPTEECPPRAPSDPELDRLMQMQERLKKMLDAVLQKDKPTKEDAETIKMLQDQLTAARIAIKARQDANKAAISLEGDTVTKISYKEPDAWLWENAPFPDDEQIKGKFQETGQRVFIYVKPAIDFKK